MYSARDGWLSQRGFPHSDTSGSQPVSGSPKLFAAVHVLLRLSSPRHPPCALRSLTVTPKARLVYFPERVPRMSPCLQERPMIGAGTRPRCFPSTPALVSTNAELSVAAAFVCALAHGCRRGPPATLRRFTTDALQARVDGMLRLPESPSRVAALIGSFPAIRDFFFDFQGTVGMTFRPLKTGSYAAQPKVGVDDDTPDVLCEVLRPREV